MITPSRFVDDAILKVKVDSPEAREWLALSPEDDEIEHAEIDSYEDYRGQMVIGTHRTIEGIDWCLLAEIDVEEAFAPIYRLVFILFWFFVVLLGVGTFIAILLSKNITNPILKLHRRSEQIEKGNWDYQVAIDSKDEIGQFSSAFDSMAARLKQSQEALKAHRDALEAKVAEKTADLAQRFEENQRFALDLEQTNKMLVLEVEERVQVERKLQHGEERFRKMFEDGPIGMVIGSPDLRFLKVNTAFCQMLDYTEPELLKFNITDVSYPEEMSENKELVKQALNGEIPFYQMEKRYIRKDGELVWGNLAVSFFKNDKEELIYFLAKVEDITERKRTENALKQAVDLADSANRAKSEFLANMSHEIRTPLNAVIGFSELLSSLVTDKKQKSYLDSIETAGKSLLTLIDDILDLAKIEAGRLEIQYEAINPIVIFKELEHIFALKIANKRLDFIIEIDKDLPSALLLDETRLRQVLLNLIGNAVKFTEQGYIKLSVHKIYTVDDHSKVDLIVSVADTGIGIPEDQQEIIFETFRQQAGQSTRKYGGTGLGLAITKRLVEMMKGEIVVRSHSHEPKGSVFESTLRDVAVSTIESVNKLDKSVDLKNLSFEPARILVVDDVESNRSLLKEWLSQVNLEIVEAEDGLKGLLFAKEYHPDLILMDIKMPVMSGYEATEQLKNNPSTQDIPVIALTASPVDQSKRQVLIFDGYLLKPVNMRELFEELSQYLKYATIPAPVTETESVAAGIDTLTNFTHSEIAKFPELMGKLEQLMPIWESLNGGAIVPDDIIEFANQIIDLGEEYKMSDLRHYGEKLCEFIQDLDFEQIENTLKAFPEMIK